MARNSIAKLAIILSANTTQFARGIGRARKATKQFENQAERTRERMRAFRQTFTAVAGSVAAFGAAYLAMASRVSRANDELGKSAQFLGLSVERMTELRLASQLAGVDVRTLQMGMQRMGRRVAEAAVGLGEAKDAIAELGFNAARLNQLDRFTQLEQVLGALQAIPNVSDRLRLSFKLFDSEGARLMEVRLRGVREQLEELNAVIDDDMVKAAARFEDSMTKMRTAFDAMLSRITGTRGASDVAEGAGMVFAGVEGPGDLFWWNAPRLLGRIWERATTNDAIRDAQRVQGLTGRQRAREARERRTQLLDEQASQSLKLAAEQQANMQRGGGALAPLIQTLRDNGTFRDADRQRTREIAEIMAQTAGRVVSLDEDEQNTATTFREAVDDYKRAVDTAIGRFRLPGSGARFEERQLSEVEEINDTLQQLVNF